MFLPYFPGSITNYSFGGCYKHAIDVQKPFKIPLYHQFSCLNQYKSVKSFQFGGCYTGLFLQPGSYLYLFARKTSNLIAMQAIFPGFKQSSFFKQPSSVENPLSWWFIGSFSAGPF